MHHSIHRLPVLLAALTLACQPASTEVDEPASDRSAGGADPGGDAAAKAPGYPDGVVEVDGCDPTAGRVLGEAPAVLVRCPTDCRSQVVYGSGVYDLSSSLCAALTHAGVVRPGQALAYVERVAAPRAFRGTAQHGISSRSHRGRVHAILGRSVDDDGRFTGARPEPPNLDEGWLRCGDNLSSVRLDPGETVVVHCPPECTTGGGLWGSNPYTADSSVCRAAVHAGAIGVEGGAARIRRGPGAESYEASQRNGTSSWAYGATGASLEIVVD